MNRRLFTAGAATLLLFSWTALAQDAKPNKQPPADQKQKPTGQTHDMQPPKGMTEEQMKACMEAGVPGPMHEHLSQGAGVWSGKTTMWMTADGEPQRSECTMTATPMMDGRFIKCEVNGEMPGMGPFNGFGVYGFDNVSQKFQSTWFDNCGTGMMVGTGDLSADKKTMTWTYTYTCPITKKSKTMREVERITGKDTRTLEMFGEDPSTGKEFKMMEISYTRSGGAPVTAR